MGGVVPGDQIHEALVVDDLDAFHYVCLAQTPGCEIRAEHVEFYPVTGLAESTLQARALHGPVDAILDEQDATACLGEPQTAILVGAPILGALAYAAVGSLTGAVLGLFIHLAREGRFPFF